MGTGASLPIPQPGPFLRNTIEQFNAFRRVGFGIVPLSRPGGHFIRLVRGGAISHPEGFACPIKRNEIEIVNQTESGLAQGLFHLERAMELRGMPVLKTGKIVFRPRFDLRLHCDVWGGYTVTPRLIDVPRRRETFLLMARYGINATQVRVQLSDVFHDARYPEISNPR